MSRKTIRLQAPPGTDEANHGTERYRVDNDGTVEVPEEAVGPLEARGGFSEIVEPAPLPEGAVRMLHDDDYAACSFGGDVFAKQDDGSFHVPVIAVAELLAHGFVPVDED